MLRTTILSTVTIVALTYGLGAGATSAAAAPDPISTRTKEPVAPAAQPAAIEVVDPLATRLQQDSIADRDAILYRIISDQISEMRRKSALPVVMCIAESTDDGAAGTISGTLMDQLEADNAQVPDSLFTLKHATECRNAGQRVVDRATHERAMIIVAGPVETQMKDLLSDCGDYVGGFVRAAGDSDFDFYTANGGDVARKLGCELAR